MFEQPDRDALGVVYNAIVAMRDGNTAHQVPAYAVGMPVIATQVDELHERPPVQAAPVDPAALKAVLLDPEVLAAIAKAVNDEEHARSAD
jgi:hypothetical protein